MPRTAVLVFLFVSLFVFAFACGLSAQDPNPPASNSASSITPRISSLTSRGGARYQLYVFSFPIDHLRTELIDLHMSRALEPTLRQTRASLVINGGFFRIDGSPQGLVHAQGQTLSPLDPTLGGGVFTLFADRASLHATEEFAQHDHAVSEQTIFAIQSKPRLVVDGAVNIRRDDGKYAERTALCLRQQGTILDVILARGNNLYGDGGPSLYELAHLLKNRGCESALNLDGGPSTGAAWRQGRSVRSFSPRSPVRHAIAFTRQNAPADDR